MTDLFQDVIEGMAEGFALYDAEECLVRCNERFRELYPSYTKAGLLTPGLKYADLVRIGVERGLVLSAFDRVEDYVKDRLAEFRDPTGPFEVARANGTWVRCVNKKTRDGRTICLREDITDFKRTQEALTESERKYREIFDNLTDVFYRADSDGRIIVVSPSVKDLFGYEPDEVIGQQLADYYFNPEDRQRFLCAIHDNGGQITGFSARLRRKNGSGVWISTSARTIRDASGDFVAIEGIARDVTNEHNGRLALEEIEARLTDAQRIARIGSWERDIHGDTLWWSHEVYRIFGLDPLAIQPSYEVITSAIHPDDREGALSAINRSREQGRTLDLDHRIVAPNGDIRWVRQQAEVILDSAGNPAVLRGTIHDVTIRKQAEEKIRELNADLEGRVDERTKELAASEQRFKDFAETGADWFWETGPENQITWFSLNAPCTRAMLGMRRWEIGDDAPGLTDWTEFRSYMIKHEAFQDLEVAIRGVNEVPTWLSISGRPLFGDDGRYLGHRGVTRDVTEKRGVELALSAQRKLFDQLITTTSQGYWYIDLEGGTLDVNPAMCEILGRPRDEVIGRSILEFVDAANQRIFAEQLDLRRLGIHGAYEIELQRADGASVACINNPTQIVSPSGQRVGSIGLFTDISGIKQIQASLEEANLVARNASQAKTEFLSSMSHELRTPLNAILGFGQLLELDTSYPLVDDQIDSVRQILKSGTYLLGLIEEVLDLAKIEGGNTDLSIEDVAIASIVADCIEVLRPLASNADIGIENRVDAASDLWVLADRTRLKQVLLNLLSNAIKYNAPGGQVTISNTMFDRRHAGTVPANMHRVMVTDTGLGIPEQSRAAVFQPFERLGREVGEIEGTGIGLSISRRLVDLMGGIIDFESQEGRGTTFWVDLPVSMTRTRVSLTDTDDTKRNLAANDQAAASSHTVLYIEDNPANLRLMERIVRHVPNFTLMSTHTAELGLEMARRHRPEVVILDINLPGMDGFEALARLRRYEETRDIPVIALSANAMPSTIQKGLAAGFRNYLTKPINVSELLEALSSLSDGRKIV